MRPTTYYVYLFVGVGRGAFGSGHAENEARVSALQHLCDGFGRDAERDVVRELVESVDDAATEFVSYLRTVVYDGPLRHPKRATSPATRRNARDVAAAVGPEPVRCSHTTGKAGDRAHRQCIREAGHTDGGHRYEAFPGFQIEEV